MFLATFILEYTDLQVTLNWNFYTEILAILEQQSRPQMVSPPKKNFHPTSRQNRGRKSSSVKTSQEQSPAGFKAGVQFCTGICGRSICIPEDTSWSCPSTPPNSRFSSPFSISGLSHVTRHSAPRTPREALNPPSDTLRHAQGRRGPGTTRGERKKSTETTENHGGKNRL